MSGNPGVVRALQKPSPHRGGAAAEPFGSRNGHGGAGGADLPGLLKVRQDDSPILQFYSVVAQNVWRAPAPRVAVPAVETWLLDSASNPPAKPD